MWLHFATIKQTGTVLPSFFNETTDNISSLDDNKTVLSSDVLGQIQTKNWKYYRNVKDNEANVIHKKIA